MFRKITLIFLILGLTSFLACSDDTTSPDTNTIVGSGILTTVERTLPSFHSIENIFPVSINIQYGGQQNVSITVDDNAVDYIITTVSNGELLITSAENVTLNNINLSISLTMTDLEGITIIGPATISGNFSHQIDDFHLSVIGPGTINLNLNADEIISTLPGPFSIVLSGNVTKHTIGHAGPGNLMAFGLISDTTIINLSGTGMEEVYASEFLDINISGIGTVYYRGDPEIEVDITGTGNVINANP